MASKTTSIALFLVLNLLFFALVASACDTGCPAAKPKPKPKSSPTPTGSSGTCPRDALKLGVCANLLNGLLGVTIGKPPKEPCCSLIKGLVDLEAAVCLCTALKANVLGLNLNLPISLSLLLNDCGCKTSSIALFLVLNLLFFTLFASACDTGCPSAKPKPKPSPTPSGLPGTCPRDALKLGVCANLLNGLLGVAIGKPPKEPCCSLIKGLVDLEAAVCLCTALKANVLGLNLNLPISLSLLLNDCGCKVPKGFQCA
ncbi:hypothetical protein V2J09_020801 [Rumex salicifolius]